MRKLLNTLHVTTQGAYVHRDGETLSVKVGNEIGLRLPVHTIESLLCYGQVTCSPFVLGLCCERGVGVSLLTENGRFLARVTGPVSGNVLLRRQQYRTSDAPAASLPIVTAIVAAKIANSRLVLLRGARETTDAERQTRLRAKADHLSEVGAAAVRSTSIDEARGYEGVAAQDYLSSATLSVATGKSSASMDGPGGLPWIARTLCCPSSTRCSAMTSRPRSNPLASIPPSASSIPTGRAVPASLST